MSNVLLSLAAVHILSNHYRGLAVRTLVLGDPTLPSVGRRERKGPGFRKNTQIITRDHMPSIITTPGGGPKKKTQIPGGPAAKLIDHLVKTDE